MLIDGEDQAEVQRLTRAVLGRLSERQREIIALHSHGRRRLEIAEHRWHPSLGADHHEYVGRRRVLFTLERDMHAGTLDAWRLPTFPPDHPHRVPKVRRVRLPG